MPPKKAAASKVAKAANTTSTRPARATKAKAVEPAKNTGTKRKAEESEEEVEAPKPKKSKAETASTIKPAPKPTTKKAPGMDRSHGWNDLNTNLDHSPKKGRCKARYESLAPFERPKC